MKGIRVFVLVLAGCALVAALVGPYLVSAVVDQLRELGTSTAQDMKQLAQDAKTYAETHTQSECLAAAVERTKTCDSVFCQPAGAIFASTCLEKATPSPELCREIPESAISRWLWPGRRCSELDADSKACRLIYQMVAAHCEGVQRARERRSGSQSPSLARR